MRVLLSDGSGLTSRQCATCLSQAGHQVEALSPLPWCLCRFTRRVTRIHRVPAYGADPFGWLDASLAAAAESGAEVFVPTQEHVAVMALAADRIRAAGLLTAVPDFSALAQVQDKLTAYATLARLDLPQPPATIAASRVELESAGPLPAFVKTPIGTASTGVSRVATPDQLRELAARFEAAGVFADGGRVLVQQPAEGPLVMVQTVFAQGELVAFHACERVREGTGGGASHKCSLQLPAVRDYLGVLGRELRWHGGLSADVILSSSGPQIIDLNPRLVEPVNAYFSGVDLVGALLEVARTGRAEPQHNGQAGVRTHQLLLAVLGAAQRAGRRRDVGSVLWSALYRSGDFQASREELTPVRRDPVAAVPVAVTALTTMIRPESWRYFTSAGVDAYALTPAAWNQIKLRADTAQP